MLRRFLANMLLTGILPLALLAQQQKGYEINGRIKGLKEGEKVTMLLTGDHGFSVLDSAYAANGKFYLSGVVPQGPRLYNIRFDKHPHYFLSLVIENNEHITIRSEKDIDKLNFNDFDRLVTKEGSPSNQIRLQFEEALELYYQYNQELDNCIKKIKDSIGFNGSLLDGIHLSKEMINESLYWSFLWSEDPHDPLRGVKHKPAILVFMNKIYAVSGHASFLADLYNGKSLDEYEKNSFYGEKLKEMTMLCIGQPFPEFVLPTPDGKPLASKEVVSMNKMTLIHFWASNSVKRKEYDEELRYLYKKYHDKEFNIIGVSTDNYLDEWKKTIQSQQYPWYNVSDIKGNMVDKVYHELGDPEHHNTTDVLIDPQGNIIAWDVTGLELQWYLWKIFGK